MNILNNNFASIESVRDQISTNGSKKTEVAAHSKQQVSFAELLEQNVSRSEELRFSKHANERLASRNIDLSEEQVKRLESGTNRAREKGIKESLVMVDDLAFIVNVKNSTVITAVNDMKDAVFTNIDGAVIS